jgi:outer membrane protein TolC
MQKFLSIFLSLLLILPSFTPSYAAAVKSSGGGQNKSKDKNNKPKNLDQVYGQEGIQNEDKAALVNVDALTLQNYANIKDSFNFETYTNVTLKSAILEALSQSNVVKSAKEKVVQSEIALKDAYAAYLPLVDFQYSNKYTRNFKTGDEKTDTAAHYQIDDENYGFRVQQSLYSGGATGLKIKSLKYKLEEAKRKYQIVVDQNIQNAIKAYFGVLFNHKNVQVNEKNMEKLNKILEITQVKYDSGALSIGDLSAVKANIANASGKLIKVKSSLADALDYYTYILGEDFENTFPYQENFKIKLDPLEGVYEDIIQNNLSLVNYRLNIESTKYKLLNIKASFKPKVDLELSYKNVLDKEDFKVNEETTYAKVTMSYNIYNAGKDTRKTLQAYSSLRELKYRYKEEVKKLKWSTSKLYNSITSLDKTIESTVEEVDASNEMVNAYWEGFQLGEQDLQVLLQGQRQLNSAELDLLKYKQDYLTNMFKLIKDKGQLSLYFGINPNSPDYIDFSRTATIDPIVHIDLSTGKENNLTTQPKELNTTIDEYLEVVKESTFEDIVSFKDKFLTSDDDSYTLVISDFTNHFDAYKYIKTNRMLQNAFSYDYFSKDGELLNDKLKRKAVAIKRNIAYGIYSSEDEAKVAQNNIFDTNNKTFTIAKVKDIKDAYGKYVAGLETQIDPFIIKPKIIKTFITDQKFKNTFLKAEKYFFTINIVSLSKVKYAAALVKKAGIEKESFVFKYGRNGEWVKVMYGVFATYSQAYEALSKHPELVDKYQPIIEKVEHKQKLYKKYKKYNGLPKWYYEEQKRIKEDKKREAAAKKAKKEAEEKAKKEAQLLIEKEKEENAKKLQEKKEKEEKQQLEIEDVKEQKQPTNENSRELEAQKLDKNNSSDVNEVVLDDLNEVTKDERIEELNATIVTAIKADENEVLQEKARIEEEKQKALEEAKRLQEKMEAEKLAKEKARLEKEKLEAEKKAEQERLEQERIAREKAELERKASIERERQKAIEEAKKLQEELAKKKALEEVQEKARIEEEKQKALEEAKRLQEKMEAEKLVKEKARLEQEKQKILKEAKRLQKKINGQKNNNSSSFIDKFQSAPKEYYTIKMASIPSNNESSFIKRFIIDDKYVSIKENNTATLYYGLYTNKTQALQAIENLHPRISGKVTIKQIQSIKNGSN